jgi:predicted porin
MTKKLLPTMIGVALAGGMAAAQADVTVFGHIDTSVVNWDNYMLMGGNDTNFLCTTCSIGFKGSEDLGNGLKAIFSLDFQYDTMNRNPQTTRATRVTQTGVTPGGSPVYTTTSVRATSNNAITDRDQWLGLAGNFGQVRVGTISTSYKSHGALLDPGYRTSAQMRDWGIQSDLHSGAGEEGQGRATNTARYDSPDWNGLKVTAHYTLDTNKEPEDDNPYGAGVEYSNGGLLVFADYITTDTGDDDDAYKAGAKFTMNNFAVFGQYEVDGGLISQNNRLFANAGVTADKGADVWMVGASYTMGNNTVYGAYSQGENADSATYTDSDGITSSVDTSYDAWEIVGVHSMSKQTLVYLGYVQNSPDEGDVEDATAWALGMKHLF